MFGCRGLERNINGSDKILVCPELRGISEVHEADVWAHLMGHIQELLRTKKSLGVN